MALPPDDPLLESPPPSARALPVRVFLSYANEDEDLRAELVAHLSALQREGIVGVWHERMIGAGASHKAVIDDHLEAAEVVLLLVSADFLASNECYDDRMARALERAQSGKARVIPIVVRSCVWKPSRFDHLEPLPKGGRAVKSWADRDEAWTDVVEGLREAIAGLRNAAPAAIPRAVPREHAQASPAIRALAEQRDAARAREQRLRREGHEAEADVVLQGILETRRKMREGGQLHVGDALGDDRYLLLERVGKGGFASVWRAHDRTLDRPVAIKVLHTTFAGDAMRRERFFRGARVMANLDHEGVTRVLDPHGEDGGFLYFVMELVNGVDLQRAVLGGKVPREKALSLVLSVGEALAAAHARAIVHRDVKPANILLDEAGAAKLTDFDLVALDDTTGGTRTGALGTFVYAAPESLDRPQDADARADVYGLAMTAVFTLHGHSLPVTAFRHTDVFVDGLPCGEGVKEVLKRALDWDREKRFADARALCVALKSAMEGGPSGPWIEGRDSIGRYAILTVAGVAQRMRWIPPGRFLMGSPESEEGRSDDEGPQHEVELTQGYWLADTPCTQAMWEAVMGINPSRFRDPDRPVENVSWEDCQGFIRAIETVVPGLQARLPSEAEWEYACRAGTTAARYGEIDAVAWYSNNSGKSTHPVGKKQANPFGLYDMLGNVWEWCEDGMRPYVEGRMTDPRGPGAGSFRVRRGGSWRNLAGLVRAAFRYAYPPDYRYVDLGFRLARGLAPSQGAEPQDEPVEPGTRSDPGRRRGTRRSQAR